jgi:hypothetical protein
VLVKYYNQITEDASFPVYLFLMNHKNEVLKDTHEDAHR